MDKPELTVTVEPTSGNQLFYQAQAPSFKDGVARTKIIVRLRITNNEDDKVRVTGIAFHYPGTNRSPKQMEAETKSIVPDSRDDGWWRLSSLSNAVRVVGQFDVRHASACRGAATN